MRRILFPGKAVMIPLTILSAVLLTSIFAFDFRQNIFAYLSYMLSAYTMMIICLKASKQIKKGIDLIESKSQHVNRYLNDILFRTHVSLYTSLALNSIYAIVKFWIRYCLALFLVRQYRCLLFLSCDYAIYAASARQSERFWRRSDCRI